MTRPDPAAAAQRSSLQSLRSIIPFIKPYRRQILLAGLALIVTSSTMLALGKGLQFLIDEGFMAGSGELLNQATFGFGALVLVLALGTFTRHYLVSWLGERVVADLRKAVFRHLVTLHPGFFDANHSGEIQSRITADTTLLQSVIGSSVSIALRNFLMFVGGVILLFVTNFKLASIVVLSVPLVVLPIKIFGRRVKGLSRQSQDRLADVGSYVAETLGQIKTVQAYNHQPLDQQRFDDVAERTFDASVRQIQQRSTLIAIVITLVLGAVGLMLWIGGHDVLAGRISGGELAAFVFYAVIVGGAVSSLSEVIGELHRAAGAIERLMDLLNEPVEIRSAAETTTFPSPAHGRVDIDKVAFRYPTRPDVPALRCVDFVIEPGQTVALVGHSGAGKSTLVDLLLRFYDVNEGAIRFDGVDIRQLDLEVLRQQFALVPQMPALFSGTIRDNILFGAPDASEQQLLEAAKAAHAWEFIERLPEGLETRLGERGVSLSGGQRQRVAIARAILRNPTVLLLDEATSALDAQSEYQVQQAINTLLQGRTSLVIAHRLATIINADKIVVLDAGEVVASGTHQELLESTPIYQRLAQLQFGG